MEPNYVFILDFTQGILNIIHLTPEELARSQSEEYEGDFESFLSTLEEKYGFRLSNCQWMCSETLSVYRYENGEEATSSLAKYLTSMITKSESDKEAWKIKAAKSFQRGEDEIANIQRERKAVAHGKVIAFQHILSKLEYPNMYDKK